MNINALSTNQPSLWQSVNPVNQGQNLLGQPQAPQGEVGHTHGAHEIGDRCETCSNRFYQDVSDDPGVSFQAPTRLTPGQAATAVPAHEREHYNRESAKAHQQGRDILHNSIRIFMDVCPECGIQFVSGGQHKIITRGSDDGGNMQGQEWMNPVNDSVPWYEAF
jgi:hypothetical protein